MHCNLLVGGATSYNDGTSSQTAHTVKRTSDGPAGIQGDSGGPVIMPIANSDAVHAYGMVEGGFHTNYAPNCGTVKNSDFNQDACQQGLYITSIPDILAGLRANGRTVQLYMIS